MTDDKLFQFFSQYGRLDINFYADRGEELTGNLKISSCYGYDLIEVPVCEQTMTPGSTVFIWTFKRPYFQTLKQITSM